jgi:uncharacterized membrane protein
MEINVIVFALLTAFLWGLSPVIYKHVLNDIHPNSLIVISSLFYFVSCLIFVWWNRSTLMANQNKIKRRHVLLIGIATVFTAFIPTILYFHALQKHDSHMISALIYSCPVFTLILAVIFLKEQVTMIGLTGIVLIASGVVCLAFNKTR